MNSIKIERINSAIQREISYILLNEVKDSNIKFVTVTAVKTTNDLSKSKIYVTVLKEEVKIDTMSALKNAKGFIRSTLADRVDIRHIPELEFVYDESIEYGKRIENKIKEIHEN
jgi:ribosome-binding factor A